LAFESRSRLNLKLSCGSIQGMERVTRLELATSTLEDHRRHLSTGHWRDPI